MSVKKLTILSAVLAALVFLGCKTGLSYSEDEIGLRKSTLYAENEKLQAFNYDGGKAAGESVLIERAFENAPPMISHNTDDMLPITRENNSCLGCHLPDVAAAVGATSMPKSHFFDIAKNVDLKGKMDDKRFNCVLCHFTQVDAQPLVGNKFAPNFRQNEGSKKSNLIDVINEGVQ